jgi:hypothetical protein
MLQIQGVKGEAEKEKEKGSSLPLTFEGFFCM